MNGVTQILGGTLFQRVMENGQAFVMGVLELADQAPTDEGRLFPITLTEKLFVTLGARHVNECDPNGESFECTSIESDLYRQMWPTDEVALRPDHGQWFYAVALPLNGFKKHTFIYAALPSPILGSMGDSWYELTVRADRWLPVSPLCQSRGESALSLSRAILWPIKGDLYSIDPNPTPMRELQHFARMFYLNRFRHNEDLRNCRVDFEMSAKAKGFSPELIKSLAPSMDTMYQDPNTVAAIDLADKIHRIEPVGRAVPAKERQARAASMHQAMQQLHHR